MPNPAVAVIARREWAQRWRALLVLALAAGVLGGLVVGGAVVARRTISAPERLFTTVAPGDVHLRLFAPGITDQAVARPEVEAAWVGGVGVGRIEGAPVLQYAGVVAPTRADDGLVRPVVVAGRAADPTDPTEVVVTELIAQDGGITVGSRLTLAMLSAEELFQFDTGFGDPDGPTLTLDVVGVVRVPPGLFDGTPVVATPAFAEQHAVLFSGFDVRVHLRGGAQAAPAYVAAVQRLADPTGEATADDFALVGVDEPRAGTDSLFHSSRVLFAGLLAAVVVGGLAVLAALAQAWARHHGAAAGAQRIEAALGLPSGARVLARTLPAIAGGALAGTVAAGIGSLASWKQPVGSLWRVEPARGWRFDWVAVLGGGVAVALATVGLAAATAWRAGRPAHARTTMPFGLLRGLPGRRAWTRTGAAFALGGGGDRGQTAVRLSLAACVLGVAGLAGGLVFSASLDRLVDTPARWGWTADFAIADVDDSVVARALDDPRLSAVSEMYSSEVMLNGRPTDAYAVRKRRGDTGWVIQQGRLPAAPDEVAMGAKLARRAHLRVGDEITIADGSRFSIVGLGLGPNSNLEELGTSVLFTFDGLERSKTTTLFRELLVGVAEGIDVGAVIADFADLEVTPRPVPAAVRDVSELGSLPVLLGAFLAALGAIALLHALVVTVAGRARDLAVLRALGATPRQSGLAVLAMSVTAALVGVAAGVPLGLGLARLLWGEVARSIGVRGDLAFPARLLLVPVAAVAGAALLALVPAVRAARRSPGDELRSA